MRRIEDSLDFLIFENKHLKNRFSGNGDLKKALELYLNEIDVFLSNADNDEKLVQHLRENYVIKEIPDCYLRYSKGYIKDLGYNGIWLMPINTAFSYHKYEAYVEAYL